VNPAAWALAYLSAKEKRKLTGIVEGVEKNRTCTDAADFVVHVDDPA
jgi:hypothetical protein